MLLLIFFGNKKIGFLYFFAFIISLYLSISSSHSSSNHNTAMLQHAQAFTTHFLLLLFLLSTINTITSANNVPILLSQPHGLTASLSSFTSPPITPTTSMKEYVAQLNITLESHYATTDDGYILHLHRLANPGKEVIFLQHGILASSWCWIANVPNSALGIVLHRNGYDVWMVSYLLFIYNTVCTLHSNT